MMGFMDYVVGAFETSTEWNRDNSYSALTATSDALLSFDTPATLALHVSSLSTPYFASSYTLSTLGQIDGSVSYLYSTLPLGHIPSQTPSIPLKSLVRGYRDIQLPIRLSEKGGSISPLQDGRKPTLLHATMALPPPSVLTALYARRIDPATMLSLFLYSKSVGTPAPISGPPPASILAHVQHDQGQYSIEGLGSTDSGLLGVRGLWNFGLSRSLPIATGTQNEFSEAGTSITDFPSEQPRRRADPLIAFHDRLASKPSLLSAGAEFYYSPFSHVIGLSTGLRFTTLAPHITPSLAPASLSENSTSKPLAGTSSLLSSASHTLLTPSNVPHSYFPYTMTLTLTPLTGSISSTYSVRPTRNLSLSSRFDFNFYSWESRYVVGGELWRLSPATKASISGSSDDDPYAWLRPKLDGWFSESEIALKQEREERDSENVLKFRVDDGWNIRALWTGRVKSLLVSAGVSVSPVPSFYSGRAVSSPGISDISSGSNGLNGVKKLSGSVGVSIAYST